LGPFQILTRPLILKAHDRKPVDLGPRVRIDAIHVTPESNVADLANLSSDAGLWNNDKDSLMEQGTDAFTQWLGNYDPAMKMEFDLPEAVSLSGITLYNYNAEWQTTNGVKKLDVSVSEDGTTWKNVLKNVEIPEAEGTKDYDSPIVLKLDKTVARKIRFENLETRGSGKIGLAKVIFHEAVDKRALPVSPADGSQNVGLHKVSAEWVCGFEPAEYRVFMGDNTNSLAAYRTTRQNKFKFDELKPDTTNYWRVDAVQADGSVVTGRVARLETLRTVPVAWWKMDETEGAVAKDSSAHKIDGQVRGTAHWAAGHSANALDFNGKDNYIDCGNAPALNFGDGLAVSVWVKVRKFDKPWQTIVSKGDKSWKLQRYKEQSRVVFSLTGVKTEAAGWMDVPVTDLVSSQQLDDGKWHHIVGSYDGRVAALYVDGELQESKNASGSLSQSSEPVWIGENSGSPDRFFNGWLDDVRLFDHGVSAEVVRELFSGDQPSK
jgi:hypothetical protein